jgi:flagellar motor switch protein FliN
MSTPEEGMAAVRPLEYKTLGDAPAEVRQPLEVEVADGALDALLQVPLEVQVVLGSAQPTLVELAQLKPGEVVVLDAVAGDPVLLEVAGVPFARAEVVVFEDQYAVRIVELLDDPAALVRRHLAPPLTAS